MTKTPICYVFIAIISCILFISLRISLFSHHPLAFSCMAENNLGRMKKFIEVSGRPRPAEIISEPWSKYADSYELSWKVQSFPPVMEIRVMFRKLLVGYNIIMISITILLALLVGSVLSMHIYKASSSSSTSSSVLIKHQ